MSSPIASLPLARALVRTSPFDPARRSPIDGQVRPHNGVDLRGDESDAALAVFDGVISNLNSSATGGNQLFLQGDNGWRAAYVHLDSFAVSIGQRVRAGERVGQVGRTGQVTGPHLHLELRNPAGVLVDPWPFLVGSGVGGLFKAGLLAFGLVKLAGVLA